MDKTETVVLGMGCFWSPDALFGHLPGTVRTRTGYAGGSTAHPTYRDMGDHSETVEVVYDPSLLPLERILEVFWTGHNPDNINDYKGRQYRSLVLYHSAEQLEVIREVLELRDREGRPRPETEISLIQSFYPAEERHQKYYLKRYPDAVKQLSELLSASEPEALTDSTLAARLNGLAKGYTNLERILKEIRTWEIGPEQQELWIERLRRIKW
ncbi:peptide-methionine (S)-S-oxide reductase MsrA [Gorillibacterium sp. sgz5001074]|uniref:peptide-methionine (S)-S-oxide reductase MsrA n=1 Tax=Gorillibacterium sp. sgz5001074 TaxID=3446695 RepID=UPI003F674C4C